MKIKKTKNMKLYFRPRNCFIALMIVVTMLHFKFLILFLARLFLAILVIIQSNSILEEM